MDIKDVAAINTGGASGLGAGTAKRLAKAGAKVTIFDLNAEMGIRANEIAIDYACGRQASGKVLIDHEGIGFMLTENLIDLRQSELMNDWCAGVVDAGEAGGASGAGGTESWMTNVAVSEALMRVADRCVQVMGGSGVTSNTIVEQVFREIRAFRIYDGPTEVHKWCLAKKIKRDWKAAQA